MDLTRPFFGVDAVRAGTLTRAELRGPRFRQLLRGIHVRADVPFTYLLRCEAAALSVGALHVAGEDGRVVSLRGALAGWSAAEMHGADCAPRNAPAEIVVPGGSRRIREGLQVHRGAVLRSEIGRVRIPVPGGRRPRFVPGRTVTTTSPLRTAFDLGRRADRIEAVIAIDALARVGAFDPADVLDLGARYPGARGVRRLQTHVALADALAESPMETRVRLALHDGGLPAPVLQHPVGPYRIDLAYPDLRLGIEYDGECHLDPRRAREDLERQQYLSARGWHVTRPEAATVLDHPDHVAGHVRYLIRRCTVAIR
jgi:very-short-patch-repair endonuclease